MAAPGTSAVDLARAGHSCSVGCTVSNFVHDAGTFFSQLADLRWPALSVGLVAWALFQAARSRAIFNAIRAAYPGEPMRFRDVWGGCMVGGAVSNVLPLSGGKIAQLFLTRNSIPGSSYPTLAVAISTPMVFDWVISILIMCFAFTQGVFPKPPDFSKLPAFDISFFAGHMRFTLFALTALAIAFVILFAYLSAKVRAFWVRVRQGFTIFRDLRRFGREMATWQLLGWFFRFICYWALLDAFHIGGSARNALLVLGVQVIAALFPFTPGGAGVQQALLLTIFNHNSHVASFSVGQQIATIAVTVVLGFAALVLIFRLRSFREVMARGRAQQQAEVGVLEGEDQITLGPV